MDFESIVDPLAEVDRFRAQAETEGLVLPESMTLATVDHAGRPKARVVLLKGREGRCLQFYTNYQSAKAGELAAHPFAAVCIHFPKLALQARIEGDVARLSAEVSDAYFATRPRESQIGAWASQQSRPLESRAQLDRAYAEQETRFAGGEVPRPPHWGGLGLTAHSVELWVGQVGRLHDRAMYEWDGARWSCQRLFP